MRYLSFSLKICLLVIIPLVGMTGCDDDEPTTATISGTITVEGLDTWEMWQDSGEVQVTIFPAFSTNPPAGWGEIPDGTFGPGTPGGRFAIGAPYNAQDPVILTFVDGKTTYDYSIEVEPGTYSALAAGFRHDHITDPSKRTATVGVHWNNPNTVSHGIIIRIPNGSGGFMDLFNEPAPTAITVEAGDELDLDFKVDFGILPLWF